MLISTAEVWSTPLPECIVFTGSLRTGSGFGSGVFTGGAGSVTKAVSSCPCESAGKYKEVFVNRGIFSVNFTVIRVPPVLDFV